MLRQRGKGGGGDEGAGRRPSPADRRHVRFLSGEQQQQQQRISGPFSTCSDAANGSVSAACGLGGSDASHQAPVMQAQAQVRRRNTPHCQGGLRGAWRGRAPTLLASAALLVLAVAGLLLLSVTHATAQAQAAGADAPAAPAAPAPSEAAGLQLSEVMFRNKGSVIAPGTSEPKQGGKEGEEGEEGGGGKSLDWVELHNPSPAPISIKGWRLAQGASLGRVCELQPPSASLPPGGYLVVYASDDASDLANVTTSGPSPAVTCSMALKAGQPLALLPPGASAPPRLTSPPSASPLSMGPPLPAQMDDVSYGVPGSAAGGEGADTVKRSASGDASPHTYLARPTPGAANSGPLPRGPFIYSVSKGVGEEGSAATVDQRHPPNTPLPINITLGPNLNPLAGVSLVYVIGFGAEVRVEAVPVPPEEAAWPEQEPGALRYRAIVPASALGQAGAMVRWAALATDTQAYESRRPEPPPPAPASGGDDAPRAAAYYGTVVGGPPIEPAAPGIPVMEWFSNNPDAATSPGGAEGQVLYYNGRLYDGVYSKRRGVTALLWPKPKLKFKLPTGFKYDASAPGVEEFDLQSFWFELGERSYMKETLALQAMQAVGQAAPSTFHLHVRLNGAFYGLFAFVEVVDNTFLERRGLPRGPLFKSVSGELSNLRWDLPLNEYPSYWSKGNRKSEAGDWERLQALAQGLAGGDGDKPRSLFAMEHINLPEVINEMAVQTVLLNMDRCTKNFYLYLNPRDDTWSRFPWDVDGSFGQDNSLGGKPGDTYCVLACEQWNSPLYCDSEHPQDLQRDTPWGTITVPMQAGTGTGVQNMGPAVSRKQRKLLARMEARLYARGANITKFPKPQGWEDPDRSTIGTASPIGGKGTYNHLSDALLDHKITREMYLRRLRSVADDLLGPPPAPAPPGKPLATTGRLAKLANETYTRIRPLALADAKKWNSGINIDDGYLQITSEFLPIRSEQLLAPGLLYGPGGSSPLLPTAQPADAVTGGVVLGKWEPAGGQRTAYVQLMNRNAYAVDLSGWRMAGPANFSFPSGAVVPGGSSVFLTPSLPAWRTRTSPPKAGQGLLVLAPLQLPAAGAAAAAAEGAFTLTGPDGKTHGLGAGAVGAVKRKL